MRLATRRLLAAAALALCDAAWLAPGAPPQQLPRLRRGGIPLALVPLDGTEGLSCALDERCIFFVTGNAKKEAEVNAVLSAHDIAPYRIVHVDIDLPEIQASLDESGALEIARHKCLEASKRVGGSVIVEDTSLCFAALNGLPGPYIKWFFETLGNDGLYRLLAGHTDHSAFCMCVLAYSDGPDAEPQLFVGRTQGRIVPPQGTAGFGWDAIFVPDGCETPFGDSARHCRCVSHLDLHGPRVLVAQPLRRVHSRVGSAARGEEPHLASRARARSVHRALSSGASRSTRCADVNLRLNVKNRADLPARADGDRSRVTGARNCAAAEDDFCAFSKLFSRSVSPFVRVHHLCTCYVPFVQTPKAESLSLPASSSV